MQKQASYSEAVVTKYPEQVVVALARDAAGKCNPITLGWTMIASGDPPMMAVSIGKTRHSLGAFRHARQFIIAFPSEHQADETMLFGTKSGRDCDKLTEAGAKTQPAAKIDCVLLAEAVANFECELVGEMETGDHVVFVGQVMAAHVNERSLNRLYTVGAGHKLSGLARS